jgi:hypothetical protein
MRSESYTCFRVSLFSPPIIQRSSYASTGEVFGIVGIKPEDFIDLEENDNAPNDNGSEEESLLRMHETNAYKELKRSTAWYADQMRYVPGLAVRGPVEKAFFAGMFKRFYKPPPPPSTTSSTRPPVASGGKKKKSKAATDDGMDWVSMAREWNLHIEQNPGSGL